LNLVAARREGKFDALGIDRGCKHHQIHYLH